jgi:hypothetical protein
MKEEFVSTVVTVSPQNTMHGLECDITGKEVHDDAIFLDHDKGYEIEFTIPDDSDWEWDVTDPFCARVGKCPPPGSPPHGLMGVKGTPTRKKFTVDARPTGGKQVFHYRLNFRGGRTYDPVIIRD